MTTADASPPAPRPLPKAQKSISLRTAAGTAGFVVILCHVACTLVHLISGWDRDDWRVQLIGVGLVATGAACVGIAWLLWKRWWQRYLSTLTPDECEEAESLMARAMSEAREQGRVGGARAGLFVPIVWLVAMAGFFWGPPVFFVIPILLISVAAFLHITAWRAQRRQQQERPLDQQE